MSNHHLDHDLEHKHSIMDELVCHFPYAVFSVALCLAILSFMDFIVAAQPVVKDLSDTWFTMFHSFHFMHITFAAVGSVVTFLRVSKNKNIYKALLLSGISSTIFCILSDIIFPYLGGRLLGVQMQFHICFFHELNNIVPFLIVGLLTGLALSRHEEQSQDVFGLWSHFAHIFISSLASTFYMISNGFTDWTSQIGYIFAVLVVAVVIPCTLSDIAAPMYLAKVGKNKK